MLVTLRLVIVILFVRFYKYKMKHEKLKSRYIFFLRLSFYMVTDAKLNFFVMFWCLDKI